MFAPKCGGCSRPIMENYISALNSQWHTDCFVCRVSSKYVSLFDCFTCPLFLFNTEKKNVLWLKFIQDCKKPVTGKSFYAMEGKPVCPGCVGVDEDDGDE